MVAPVNARSANASECDLLCVIWDAYGNDVGGEFGEVVAESNAGV